MTSTRKFYGVDLIIVLAFALVFAAMVYVAITTRPEDDADHCTGELDERYTDAWLRWHDGLPMRDCDSDTLEEMRSLAHGDRP